MRPYMSFTESEQQYLLQLRVNNNQEKLTFLNQFHGNLDNITDTFPRIMDHQTITDDDKKVINNVPDHLVGKCNNAANRAKEIALLANQSYWDIFKEKKVYY